MWGGGGGGGGERNGIVMTMSYIRQQEVRTIYNSLFTVSLKT